MVVSLHVKGRRFRIVIQCPGEWAQARYANFVRAALLWALVVRSRVGYFVWLWFVTASLMHFCPYIPPGITIEL
jgi:hypothetical protein